MRWTALALIAALQGGAALGSAEAQQPSAPKDMSFRRIDAPNLCKSCDVIEASGRIVEDTATKFTEFLAREKIGARPLHVILDSGGGKVTVGWALGRKLRALSASTIAGRVHERPDGALEMTPGVCISMCNSLLSAGVQRRISPGTVFGVHQFSPTTENFKNLDNQVTVRDMRAQLKMVAEWLAYAREMNIDLRVVKAQLNTPFEKIDFVAHDTLAAWSVVTASGATLPKLLRNARPGAEASAVQPANAGSAPTQAPPSFRQPDRQWTSMRVNGEWREMTMDSDADFLRVLVGCSATQNRSFVQVMLRGVPEARQKALAQQIILGGGFDLAERGVDIAQVSIGFGGVFWVRATLRPDEFARFAASQGRFSFAPSGAKAGAKTEALRVLTIGFTETMRSLATECAPKKPATQASAE